MKIETIIIIIILFCLFTGWAVGYSTYGQPTEFGNATTTTCYIGGDEGIINCTGRFCLNNSCISDWNTINISVDISSYLQNGTDANFGVLTASISASDVGRDTPSNCSPNFAVIGWENNLSTTYCTEFEEPGDYLENGTDKDVHFGNVGIGTTTPAHKLEVAGSANMSGMLNISNNFYVNKKFNVSASDGNVDMAGNLTIGSFKIYIDGGGNFII